MALRRFIGVFSVGTGVERRCLVGTSRADCQPFGLQVNVQVAQCGPHEAGFPRTTIIHIPTPSSKHDLGAMIYQLFLPT
jgi:hypothetical protein